MGELLGGRAGSGDGLPEAEFVTDPMSVATVDTPELEVLRQAAADGGGMEGLQGLDNLGASLDGLSLSA
jgi:hypothetical protein